MHDAPSFTVTLPLYHEDVYIKNMEKTNKPEIKLFININM